MADVDPAGHLARGLLDQRQHLAIGHHWPSRGRPADTGPATMGPATAGTVTVNPAEVDDGHPVDATGHRARPTSSPSGHECATLGPLFSGVIGRDLSDS